MSRQFVPLSGRIAYGIGDLPLNFIWIGTGLFLLYFYTDVLNIEPATAGLIYLSALIWDGLTDPVVATLADRTRTRWGRYRPYILFGALPLALSYPLAYTNPGDLPISNVAWALLTHCLLRTAFTVIGVPYSSLQARLTTDSQERTILAGFRMIGAGTGGLTVGVLTPYLINAFGSEREAEGLLLASIIGGAITFVALMYTFFALREPPEGEQAAADAPTDLPLWKDLLSIVPLFLRNPPLIRLFAINVIGLICMSMFGKCLIYYFKYQLERPELTTYATALLGLTCFVAVPFWVPLAGRTSKTTVLQLGMVCCAVGYLLFFLSPPDFLPGIFLAIFLAAFGNWSIPTMFWGMLPDTVEYGQVATGTRAEAKIFGFATLAQKAAIGINAWLLGLLLSGAGYVANQPQSESTLQALNIIMTLLPLAAVAAMILIIRGYEIDHKSHARLQAQLRQANAG